MDISEEVVQGKALLKAAWYALLQLTFTHIPHPIHRVSEIVAILSAGVTSIHSFPVYVLRILVNDTVLFGAHQQVYPFSRQGTTSYTPADIS